MTKKEKVQINTSITILQRVIFQSDVLIAQKKRKLPKQIDYDIRLLLNQLKSI